MTTAASRPPRTDGAVHPVPAWLWLPAGTAVVVLVLPLVVLLARTPWPDAITLLSSSTVRDAFALSLWTATTATAVSALLGVPLAWWLGTGTSRGQGLVRLLVTIPLVLPPVVGGAALLFTYGRGAPVGSLVWNLAGVTVPFTTAAVVIAQVFVAMPFLVVSLEGAFRARGVLLEEAALTLGGDPWTVFRRVTLPGLRPALLGGIALCWARAVGEFGATITFAGSIRSVTQTLPDAIDELLGHDLDAAMVASSLMIGLAVVVLVLLRGRWLGAR